MDNIRNFTQQYNDGLTTAREYVVKVLLELDTICGQYGEGTEEIKAVANELAALISA